MHIYHFSISGGLPEIYGTFGWQKGVENPTASGAVKIKSAVSVAGSGHVSFTAPNNIEFEFNASDSNPIYGNSDTVQPPALKVRVKTRAK